MPTRYTALLTVLIIVKYVAGVQLYQQVSIIKRNHKALCSAYVDFYYYYYYYRV